MPTITFNLPFSDLDIHSWPLYNTVPYTSEATFEGSGNTMFSEQFLDITGTELTVTENDGNLPENDSKIVLHSENGTVFQGVGADQYTIDRTTPGENKIIFGSAVEEGTNFLLIFFI